MESASSFRKCVKGLAAVTFCLVVGGVTKQIHAAKSAGKGDVPQTKITEIRGETDTMAVDSVNKELVITATVCKDCSKPSVCDWGQRGQAFFGAKGGKAEAFFVFTTDVSRADIDKAIRKLGVVSRRQIAADEAKTRKGLKATTVKEDYLDGDPLLVTIRYKKGGEVVEIPLESLIEEKILVEGKEVVKPYTPHFVYHGTAEAISYGSGCIVCPSGCYGGIIADNALPVLTTTSYFRVNWEKMPPAGSKVDVVLKSVYGAGHASAR